MVLQRQDDAGVLGEGRHGLERLQAVTPALHLGNAGKGELVRLAADIVGGGAVSAAGALPGGEDPGDRGAEVPAEPDEIHHHLDVGLPVLGHGAGEVVVGGHGAQDHASPGQMLDDLPAVALREQVRHGVGGAVVQLHPLEAQLPRLVYELGDG